MHGKVSISDMFKTQVFVLSVCGSTVICGWWFGFLVAPVALRHYMCICTAGCMVFDLMIYFSGADYINCMLVIAVL